MFSRVFFSVKMIDLQIKRRICFKTNSQKIQNLPEARIKRNGIRYVIVKVKFIRIVPRKLYSKQLTCKVNI